MASREKGTSYPRPAMLNIKGNQTVERADQLGLIQKTDIFNL